MLKITNLPDLIEHYLVDREFISYTTKNLTGPGENYGSLMLSVEIRVKNKKTDRVELLHAVAKTPPPNELCKQMFNTQVTFKNEIEFYRTVFPELQKIQCEHGLKPMRCFPDFVGARLNLNGGDCVDDDAVLVLDNLVKKGFVTENRWVGFGREAAELVLRDLAGLHASAIALKLQKPEVFQAKVKPFLSGYPGDPQEFQDKMSAVTSEILRNSKVRHLEPRIIEIFERPGETTVREPFGTVCHNDLWVNNTMIRYENKRPVENKFVDFQVCSYSSPASDLMFFMCTSVQDQVLRENFDDLVKFYHEVFVDSLGKLKCDTVNSSMEAFQEEILAMKNELIAHIFGMLFPVFMDKSKAVDVKDLSLETDLFTASDRHKEKLLLLVEIMEKKHWFD